MTSSTEFRAATNSAAAAPRVAGEEVHGPHKARAGRARHRGPADGPPSGAGAEGFHRRHLVRKAPRVAWKEVCRRAEGYRRCPRVGRAPNRRAGDGLHQRRHSTGVEKSHKCCDRPPVRISMLRHLKPPAHRACGGTARELRSRLPCSDNEPKTPQLWRQTFQAVVLAWP